VPTGRDETHTRCTGNARREKCVAADLEIGSVVIRFEQIIICHNFDLRHSRCNVLTSVECFDGVINYIQIKHGIDVFNKYVTKCVLFFNEFK